MIEDNPLQRMVYAMNAMGRIERSRYHLTLGGLIEKLQTVSPGLSVVFDCGNGPGDADSYRGYYSDMAFEPTAADVTAGDLLDRCKAALDQTFEGYKGGDFVMDAKTPLWMAAYSECGPAIVGFETDGINITLITKTMDE